MAFPCYLGKCHAASTEGINYAASWWDCTLTFTFCQVCWRVGSFFDENIYYCCWGSKRVWELVMQTWAFRSYSGLCKLFSAHWTGNLPVLLKHFWPTVLAFQGLGKMMPPSLFLHVTFSFSFGLSKQLNITMTSTLWTSFNSKKMLTKHLNDARRCKKMMHMWTKTCQPWRPYCFPISILRRLVDFISFYSIVDA